MFTDAVTNDDDPTPDVSPGIKIWTDDDIKVLVEVFSKEQTVDELGIAFHARAVDKRSYAAMARQLSKMTDAEKKGVLPSMVKKVFAHAQVLLKMSERREIDLEIKGVRWINANRALRLFRVTGKQLSDAGRRNTKLRRYEHSNKRYLYRYEDVEALSKQLMDRLNERLEATMSPEPPKAKVEKGKKGNGKPKTNGHSNGHLNGHSNGHAEAVAAARSAPGPVQPTQVPRSKKVRDEEFKEVAARALEIGLLSPKELINRVFEHARETEN